MQTVAQILRDSGFTDEQVTALDQKAVTAFSNVLTTAQEAQNAAELAQRANVEWYEERIVPALTEWSQQKAQYDAELAWHRAQNGSLRDSGVLPADATYQQPRDAQGRYVTGAPGSTPGSPTFYPQPQFDVNKVYERAGDAVGILTDIQWEHQKLFGQPLPVSPTELVRRADAMKLDPRTYAAREFHWDEKRAEMAKQEQEAHDKKIRSDAIAENDRKWAERVGSNPDVHMPQHNPKMADIARATRRGERQDPLAMSELERRQATRSAIHSELMETER